MREAMKTFIEALFTGIGVATVGYTILILISYAIDSAVKSMGRRRNARVIDISNARQSKVMSANQ